MSQHLFLPDPPDVRTLRSGKRPARVHNLAGQTAFSALEKKLKGVLQEWMILERDFLPLPIPPDKDEN